MADYNWESLLVDIYFPVSHTIHPVKMMHFFGRFTKAQQVCIVIHINYSQAVQGLKCIKMLKCFKDTAAMVGFNPMKKLTHEELSQIKDADTMTEGLIVSRKMSKNPMEQYFNF